MNAATSVEYVCRGPVKETQGLQQIVPDMRDAFLGDDDAYRMTRVPGDGGARTDRRARRLRLGIIASEFPPDHGGMQEHARGLVASLARDHTVLVYTSRDASARTIEANVTVNPVLQWQTAPDLRVLGQVDVDAWITLNAGLASYSIGLSAPVFAYIHGNDFTRPWLPHPDRQTRLARRLLGEAAVHRWRARQIAAGLGAARWIFANSNFSRVLCAGRYGVPEARISVVPPGMRADFFCEGDPEPDARLRLVTVSRLSTSAERKNIDGVIEAVSRLRGEIEVSYTIIGDGDDRARLQALACRLGVPANVQFLGAVDTSRIIEQFHRSDALIMAVKPSTVDVEGFGMVFAEAAATGLPSIGARTGGIPEVIEHGVTGLLLDDVQVPALVEGLRDFHRRRRDFDRKLIRARAKRFSASCCSEMIARTITTMV